MMAGLNSLALKALLLTEVRLRMRRTGTLVAVLVLIAVTWLMIGDPAEGHALMVVNGARVAYTSSCLAMGSAALVGLFLGLAGFYLVRGRMSEDVRSGAGSVLASTPVGNAVFLFGRWLGGVAYLSGLLLVFMATMLVLHALRGEGPIQPLVYLQTYALVLLPLVFFTAAVALLFDSWKPLMGKGGDVLYFFLYMTLMSLPVALMANGVQTWSPLLVFDFSGMGATVLSFKAVVHTTSFVLGGGDFDPKLAPMLLPDWLWSARMGATRVACALFAMLPLLPAIALFHRFAPDRVKARAAGGGWSPLALANRWLRPLTTLALPLFGLAARVRGLPGHVLASVALTLASNPAAIAASLVLLVLGCVLDAGALGGLTIGAILAWGVLASEIAVRDHQHDVATMTAAAPGGATRRFSAQWLSTCVLALLFIGPVLVRWSIHEPLRAAALASGVLALSSAASLLGGASRTARAFLALFLFCVYVATQVKTVPQLDVVGFNGVADSASVARQLLIAAFLFAGGFYTEWRRQLRN